MTTEDRLRDLERRLAQAEATITRMAGPPSTGEDGITLPVPLRLVNAKGKVVLELSGDADGGYVYILDTQGNHRVTIGCSPDGGWLDINQAGQERLALTLFATDVGGTIELTRNDGAYAVRGERYWSEETGMV